jgi:hypothetical protein
MRLRPHLVPLLIIATACHGSQNCTVMGCASAVSVQVQKYVAAHPTLTRLTLCADSNCRDFRRSYFARPSLAPITVSTTERKTVEVKVVATSGQRQTAVTTHASLQRQQPNGPSCGPVCYHAGLDLTSDGHLIAP